LTGAAAAVFSDRHLLPLGHITVHFANNSSRQPLTVAIVQFAVQ
jgi:hypothetical protein